MDRTSLINTIAELAEQLVDPRQHVERIPFWDVNRNKKHREWRTVQPGLLAQLYEAAMLPAGARTDGEGRPVPGSRPPLALEALSTHTAITIHAHRWCFSLRLTQRDTVEGNIRALVGAAGTLDDVELGMLASELRQWWRQAAVATGWIAPTFAPHVPCPACDVVGRLRINLTAQAAMCRQCQATWGADDGSLLILAEHIRQHTDKEKVA